MKGYIDTQRKTPVDAPPTPPYNASEQAGEERGICEFW
jgi:hypothetical protein